MLTKISTTAGDFTIRTDAHTTDQDIAVKIARRLGYRNAWATNSSGSFGSFQVSLGRKSKSGRGLDVDRTITVYR